MADKKTNSFSIFKYPEHETEIYESSPDGIAESYTTRNVGKSADLCHSSIHRSLVEIGIGSSHKIPHLDNVVGYAFYCWSTVIGSPSPELYLHELNDDTTKFFEKAGATWNSYRDANRAAGCAWGSSGGDYDEKQVSGRSPAVANIWHRFDTLGWAKSKGFEADDYISMILRPSDDSSALLVFHSSNATATGALPTSCWRGDTFGGGSVYWEGIHDTTTSLKPFVEIVYDDEVPEQPTDFKLVADENDPTKIKLEFSESPDEDVQGYMLFGTTDPKAYDFGTYQWGWVDVINGTSNTVTCAGMTSKWTSSWYSTGGAVYKAVFINGPKKGRAYTISAINTTTATLTFSDDISATEFGFNDMFLIIKTEASSGAAPTTEIFTMLTNRGYFFEKAPDDEYEIYLDDISFLTANTKYYFFVQAIDNLGMGPRGDRSNTTEFVRPHIPATTDVEIVSVTSDVTGSSLKVYEELYPVIYGIGADNTVTTTPGTSTTGLKGIRKMEIETGEFRFVMDTYTTTLSAQWASGTSVSLDLKNIPPEYFKIGNRIAIVGRTAAPAYIYDIRTITGVGDNSITVDSAPGHTFPTGTTIVYPVKTFLYTAAGSKTGKVKARVYNQYGVASAWRAPNTAPAPVSIPGLGTMRVGPLNPEMTSTTVKFNMNYCIPKPSNKTVTNYHIDMDDEAGLTDYTTPLQTTTYASDGTKYVFGFIDDTDNIISPAFDQVWDYDNAPTPTYTSRTVAAYTWTAGTDVTSLQADDDILYFGLTEPFSGLYIDIGTGWDGLVYTIEYWDGTQWTAVLATDNTASLATSGTMLWDPSDLTGWAKTTVSTSSSLYFVRITASTAGTPGDIDALVPLIEGSNYFKLTVVDSVAIDLNSRSVLQDGIEKHTETHARRIYVDDGLLGSMVAQGKKLVPKFTLEGAAHTIGTLLLSSFDEDGVPVFAGAANTSGLFDDIQVLQSIIDNGYLVKFKDKTGTTRYGYLEGWSAGSQMAGSGVYEWGVTFVVDENRTSG